MVRKLPLPFSLTPTLLRTVSPSLNSAGTYCLRRSSELRELSGRNLQIENANSRLFKEGSGHLGTFGLRLCRCCETILRKKGRVEQEGHRDNPERDSSSRRAGGGDSVTKFRGPHEGRPYGLVQGFGNPSRRLWPDARSRLPTNRRTVAAGLPESHWMASMTIYVAETATNAAARVPPGRVLASCIWAEGRNARRQHR
jgi:hypothetical protein